MIFGHRSQFLRKIVLRTYIRHIGIANGFKYHNVDERVNSVDDLSTS